MSLTIEQQLMKHELEDERRFGAVERHLTRIEGKIDVLSVQVLEARTKADSASDLADEVGDTNTKALTIAAEKRADFWKKLIAGIVSALAIAGISGLVTYFVSHHR